ncbi:MAG: hypothetical protein GY751_23450 [Bacteroidetes bacterium]|nr:hypothetical protein [Bacteroidota bacterium]
MEFYNLDPEMKADQIERIMKESAAFNHSVTAGSYIGLYEKMLQRPLLSQ